MLETDGTTGDASQRMQIKRGRLRQSWHRLSQLLCPKVGTHALAARRTGHADRAPQSANGNNGFVVDVGVTHIHFLPIDLTVNACEQVWRQRPRLQTEAAINVAGGL